MRRYLSFRRLLVAGAFAGATSLGSALPAAAATPSVSAVPGYSYCTTVALGFLGTYTVCV
ncbi:MAG TPA: hypothetical protein VMR97_08425 [Acidimicrobiales bacterium]|nr:hypothetical protein [Acidimicrobiales bacterium]